jgi:hypothetical protein
MRGLPFPQDAAFERETSYEYGTPASNFDEIPIDPALADPPIDPALQLYPIKLDPDQVRVRPYPHARRDFWAVAVALPDQLTASRHVLFLECLTE